MHGGREAAQERQHCSRERARSWRAPVRRAASCAGFPASCTVTGPLGEALCGVLPASLEEDPRKLLQRSRVGPRWPPCDRRSPRGLRRHSHRYHGFRFVGTAKAPGPPEGAERESVMEQPPNPFEARCEAYSRCRKGQGGVWIAGCEKAFILAYFRIIPCGYQGSCRAVKFVLYSFQFFGR